MPKPPTLADIAAQLGISKMTVSRALRGERHVKADLALRVRETAERLGYRPDPEVSRLMTHLRDSRKRPGRDTLGFIWTDPPPTPPTPWMVGLVEGARRRADALGYQLDSFEIQPRTFTARRITEIMEHRGVRGFILSPLLTRSRGHLSLPWEKFACVAIGLGFSRPTLHRVHHHHFLGMHTLMRQLTKLGYQRIGLAVASTTDRRMFGAWSASFLAHHPLGPAHAAELLHLPRELNRQDFTDWMSAARPEVVIDQNVMLQPWLQDNPTAPPDHATLSWSAERPDLAGIDQRSDLIGRNAVDLLVEQLHRNERGIPEFPKIVMTEGLWQPGTSLHRSLPQARSPHTLTATDEA